jgi:predicted RND superfamily exporter protein
MQNYIDFLDKQKYKVIVFFTILTALMSISLKDIAFEGSYKIWFDKESKIIKDYEQFRDRFSNDDSFVVAFSDQNGIFTPKAVQTILDLTEVFKRIDGVQKVNSLSNYQYITSEDDDIIIEDFLFDTQNLATKKQQALKENLILNQLISNDAKATMFSLRLNSSISSDEEFNIKVMNQLQSILNKYETKTGYKFYIGGGPAITASLVTISQHDAQMLMPLAVASVTILLILLFRNSMGLLIPSIVVVFTFLMTLSIQMMLGYKLNNFTVNIPSFITAIAIADSMHLFLAWVYYKSKLDTNKEAVIFALKNNIIPIAMTSFTTAVGFATLTVSNIEPISTLGIAITTGALIAFILSVTMAPAILLVLKDDYKVPNISFLNFSSIDGYGKFIVKHDKKIVGIFVMVFIAILIGLKDIKVDSNSIKYFQDDTVVRSGSNFIEKNLTGSMVYEIILDSKSKEGIKEPKFLNHIIKFEKELKDNFQNITFTTSLKDIIIKMQENLNQNSIQKIPNDKNLVAQYLLLYSMSLPQGMELNDKVDTTQRYLRLSLNSNIQDTSKDLKMIEWIEKYWQTNTPYKAQVQGQTTIFAYMQNSVTDTLINSIALTLLIVVFAMYIIFRNIKMIWLFILPNIAPILLVGGVMGYVGISIDIGVAISAAVILGIAVDDTIHFFSKYFDAIKTRSFEEAIDYVISHSGNAMILTTFILSVTFSIFMISSFVPNINFAIVTVVALNLALLLDLILLPALLSIFYIHKR